jgi:hypothetical protein
MVKLLYASLHPYYPFRMAHSGQRSLHDLLHTAQGIDKLNCAALCYSDLADLPSWEQWQALGIERVVQGVGRLYIQCGYPVDAVYSSAGREAYWRKFDQICANFKPDVILTGQHYAMEVIRYARYQRLPTIWNLDTSPGQGGVYEIPDLIAASRLGVVFICCSEYVKQRLETLTNMEIRPYVVYPPMSRELYRLTSHQSKYITMVNPVEVKGGNLLEPIVQSFPGEEFMFAVGGEGSQHDDYWRRFKERMSRYNNVTVVPRATDIRNVFSQAKLLLVPSQSDEALDRLVWEAQCGGIPCLVSATGGLPEALGAGGELIQDFTQPAAWIEALQKILHLPEYLPKLYLAAQESARRTLFEPENSVTGLMEAVNAALNPPI